MHLFMLAKILLFDGAFHVFLESGEIENLTFVPDVLEQ
jgi:hypothetical protein